MKFKIDENLPIEIAELLQQAGHDAATVIEQLLGGKADSDIISVCQQEEYALVTLDMDFADIRVYPPGQFYGLIVLRMKQQDKSYLLHAFSRLLPLFSSEPLEGHLWIV